MALFRRRRPEPRPAAEAEQPRLTGSQLLVQQLRDAGGSPRSEAVAVPLETFFEGNDDAGSIAPDLGDHPGPARIYEVLRILRARADVLDVVVLVRMEADEYEPDEWPFAEAVHVITSAPAESFSAVADLLDADPVEVGGWSDDALSHPPVPPGHHVCTIWWD